MSSSLQLRTMDFCELHAEKRPLTFSYGIREKTDGKPASVHKKRMSWNCIYHSPILRAVRRRTPVSTKLLLGSCYGHNFEKSKIQNALRGALAILANTEVRCEGRELALPVGNSMMSFSSFYLYIIRLQRIER